MNNLKQLFPRSFAVHSLKSLLGAILFYVIISIVVGFLFGFLDGLPLLGFVFKVLGSLLSIYVFVGIALAVLRFFGIVKS